MSNMTCPLCSGKIHRVTDREYILSRGWKFRPWTPEHRRDPTPFRNPKHPHEGFTLSHAITRQEFYDHRGTLPVVRCLWDDRVRDIYVVGGGNGDPLIGNTDGYDDWGHTIIPQDGLYKDERFNYTRYNYVKGGAA